MSETVKGLKLIVTVVDRGKGKAIVAAYHRCGVTYHQICLGRGTAKTELLERLGLGHRAREVIFSLSENDCVPESMDMLNKEMDFKKPGRGVAFTIPLASVGGSAALKCFLDK